MDSSDGKRKKDRGVDDDDDKRREKKSKRVRSRSRSPMERRVRDYQRKRRHSRSRSPEVSVKRENENRPSKESGVKSEPPARKAKETDMLNTRTGGAYIPPARLRMMQAQITDKSSMAYQRLAWEALKKSIHGHINKINVGNIGIIIKELLKENIVRGRGLLCRSVIQAQAASPTFTNVYAALVSAVNSRFPNIGELLLKRLVIQFKRGFKRNDKAICISSASFIAHLVNQRVAHEILALELLTLLVETPTDDSVEVAIAFLKECGQKLTEVSSKGVNAIFEMLRNILHEGQLDKRVQYMIEVMFQVWKDGFKDHPALIEELELVPEEEQFTHLLMLDDGTDSQDILNVFKFDEKYEENEQKYKTLSREILGSDAESGDEDGSGESGSEESDDDEEGQEGGEHKGVTIIDNTETNLVALRRTIYLTINSSLDFEECAHKLMKMQLKPGQEVELCHMFLDCCAEQRTYEKFYGLLAQRFCNINRIYIGPFEEIFKDSYLTAHRLDTNRLRNVSKFFAHLLFTDSISWEVLECVKLNEEDTTSSSRIYFKILFQELAEYMGLKKLNDRLRDPTLQGAFSGVFPRDNPKNTRFSINFFTSIGLGGLTVELREHLKQMPKNVPPPAEITVGSGSSSDSSSSSSSSSDSSSDSSSSDSEDEKRKKKKDKKKSKKNKTPKTPENVEAEKDKDVERWGHDGFYETYGKDAQRHERNERDKDNFAIPREVPKRRDQRNDDRGRDRDDAPRNRRQGDDDRRERDRREDNRSDNSESRRNRDVDRDNRYPRDDDNDGRRNRDFNRDNYRRERNVSERDSGYESRSQKPNDEDRRDRNKNRNDTNDKDRNDNQREKDNENVHSKTKIYSDEEDKERSSRDRKRDEQNDSLRSRRYDEEEDRERSKRDRNRDEQNGSSKSRRHDEEEDRERSKRERNRDERTDSSKSRRNEEEEDRDRSSRDRKRDERNDSSKSRRHDEEEDRERSKRDRYRDEQNDSPRSRRHDEVETQRSSRDKSQKSDEENKPRSKKEKRSKREKDRKSSDESDSSEEESTSRKRDKDRRKDKDDSKSKKRKSKRDKENDDGWDIRGSSIRRDTPEPSRFWDTYEGKRQVTVDRSPDRSERSKDNRRDR